MTQQELSVDEFRLIARESGLVIKAQDIEIMYEGYNGLKQLLTQLSEPLDPQDLPSLSFKINIQER